MARANCELRSRFENSFRKPDDRLSTNALNGSFKISRVFKADSLSLEIIPGDVERRFRVISNG